MLIYRSDQVSDDHINLKALQATDSGHVFAIVKTSTDDTQPPGHILVLHRKPDGSWESPIVVWPSIATHTRPIIMVDSVNHRLYAFATTTTNGGTIVYKQSSDYSAGPVTFPGADVTFMKLTGISAINDATSTKQNVDGLNGMHEIVVLAANGIANNATRRYVHNVLPLDITAGDADPDGDDHEAPTATRTATPTLSVTATPHGHAHAHRHAHQDSDRDGNAYQNGDRDPDQKTRSSRVKSTSTYPMINSKTVLGSFTFRRLLKGNESHMRRQLNLAIAGLVCAAIYLVGSLSGWPGIAVTNAADPVSCQAAGQIGCLGAAVPREPRL